MSGTSAALGGAVATTTAPAVIGASVDTKQTFFDFQAQGEVAGKELGVYAQYANAPATVNGNSYNGSKLAVAAAGALAASDRKAWTIGADYSVIPHVLSIGAAYRNAKTGQAIGAADVAIGRGVQNNALTLTAVYDLVQNVALHINYSQYSGNNTNTTAAGVVQQKNLTTFMLEAAW
jgi:predicted porin